MVLSRDTLPLSAAVPATAIALVLALFGLGAAPAEAQSSEEIIRATWPDYEEDYAISIAACESGLDPGAYNPYSGAVGLFQFMPSTAASLGYSSQEMYDPWTASTAAAQLQDVAGWGQWGCAYY